MRFISKTWILLIAFALLHSAVLAASFTAALDRDTLTLGESTTLSLNFEGVQPSNVPAPNVPGLSLGSPSTSSSQQIDFNSGRTSSTLVISYPVTPQRTGEFTIPALTADVGGQQLSTAPLKLIVNKAAAPSTEAMNSGNEVAFMKLIFPKQKIYIGESVIARLELYLRDDVQNISNFQMTSSPTEGFSAGKTVMVQNQQRRVRVGSRFYNVIPLLMPLTTVKTGTLALGPLTANVVVVLPGGFFGEQRQVSLATETANVTALPLPEENKPANFSGAIGTFTMSATAGPSTITVGDPVTVRVKISGHGSLDSLTLPSQDAWQNFKAYPPTTKLETSDQFGFQGTKTFEQIISPLNNDVHELPPVHFDFFNPEDGQYHSLKSVALPLTVRAAGSSPLPALAANKNEEKPVQDILPIKQDLGALRSKAPLLLNRPGFLAAQILPVLAFIVAFVWRKRMDNLANNPRLRRQRAVAALIASGTADLKKFAGANQSEDFFATLFRLLQEQLGERLDCPASAITENVIDGHSLLRGAASETRESLHGLFQLCNQARYAPVRGSAELNSVAAQFEKVVGELRGLNA